MKRPFHICIACFLLAVLAICSTIWLSTNHLVINHYDFETQKAVNPIRIVVLSDLHNHEFGENNSELVQKVCEQEPDLVLLAGDFLNEDSENADVLCYLAEKLSTFAPVYFALGNHEEMYMENHNADLVQQIEDAGAKVLEEDYVDLEINGTGIRLGGMYGYAFGLNGHDDAAAIPAQRGKFLREFQDTDRLKIMMAHRPDSFIFGNAASYWDVDLVVSGHDHGGQIVIPFKGGLYGGDQGWFPEYVHGMYQKDNIRLFVTSGLGSDGQKLPRFNNPPEIAVIEVKKVLEERQ